MFMVHCVSSVGRQLFLMKSLAKRKGEGFDIMTIFRSISAGHYSEFLKCSLDHHLQVT